MAFKRTKVMTASKPAAKAEGGAAAVIEAPASEAGDTETLTLEDPAEETIAAETASSSGPIIPDAALLFQVSGVHDVEGFLTSAGAMSWSILDHLGDALPEGGSLFDFGCGVGKALIGVRNLRPDVKLYGCDLSQNLIDWCASNIPGAFVWCNDLSPPLGVADNTFDTANAVSVFTHLTLEHFFRWAWEIHRVLKPGGHFHLTTHGPAFYGLLAEELGRGPDRSLVLRSIGDGMFLEFIQPDIHSGEGQRSVAIALDRAAMETLFSGFEIVRYYPEQEIGNAHDAYVLRKTGSASIWAGPIRAVEQLSGDGVTFTLPVEGHRTFKVFGGAASVGMHAATPVTAVEASLDGKVFHEEQWQVGRGTRITGDKSLRALQFAIPGDGKLVVKLKTSAEADWKHSLDMVQWMAPHIF